MAIDTATLFAAAATHRHALSTDGPVGYIALTTGTTDYDDPDTTNGNKFKNNGKVRIHIIGATGATGTVKAVAARPCNYDDGGGHANFKHDMVTAANALDAATKEVVLGPFPPSRFNQGDGEVEIQYTGTVTNIKIAVVEEIEEA